MPEKRTLSPAEQDGMIDSAVLGLLVHADDQRLWSRDEIDRELGSDTTDSLNRLYGAGLIHRLDKQFFWATRAAPDVGGHQTVGSSPDAPRRKVSAWRQRHDSVD